MNVKMPVADVGIIVGRFHVHELHNSHKDLINSVVNNHKRTIIFLGLAPVRNTINNPLDFKSRQRMINEAFPDIEVHYIDDVRDDTVWSNKLDYQIDKWLKPNQTCILYGGRDSFITHYSGKYPTCELESKSFLSGTQIRKNISIYYTPTKDFRAGMIAATASRFPVVYQTIDVAIFNDKGEWLFARKPLEKRWRFIGGFSLSDSLEEDVRRETKEEANIEIGDIKYVFSTKIKDWRYEREVDKIKTAFFTAKYIFGKPEGGDDVEEVAWFKLKDIDDSIIVEEHLPLLNKLKEITK